MVEQPDTDKKLLFILKSFSLSPQARLDLNIEKQLNVIILE